MTTKMVTPIVAVNKSQLRDDVVETALANGFTLNDINTLEKQLEYRRRYNLRPEVVAKRKVYTQQRYLKLKALRSLLTAQL